ncbi:hypothetical protein N7474_006987 [Penicillium riverlandense]|uniref:uncharacterized protein n=1 Tax=Penicillium riverlandense TaxID=1903569 RepID=UPI002547E316|nr:uncharacterized protein N7474_006987 [Penicillium riverlandense]KAJ5815210.1 hypothetical protein N7474_006987 [Penicillium riverlandense]
MAPRSQLEIHTASVLRLVKEEASYHRELKDQAERVQKLEAQTGGDDENREYTLKQEIEEGKKGSESNVEHITAAKDAIAQAKTAEREIS